jgi:hypothetical protein
MKTFILNHSITRDLDYRSKSDSRIIDPIRNQQIQLDNAPPTSNLNPSNVSTGYYKDYHHLNAGAITYYINEDLNKPYYNPNFVLNNTTSFRVFKEPMGSCVNSFTYTPKRNTCLPNYMNDELIHREDVMARQLQTTNRSKYFYTQS